MKKFIVIIVFILVIIFIVSYNIKTVERQNNEVKKFNQEYEYFDKNTTSGIDITSLINKAISNNEKYDIPRDKEGLYILDDEYSIVIYVKMIINDNTYRMERLSGEKLNKFTELFGSINFKCTEITYHEKNGRIASMTFEATEY